MVEKTKSTGAGAKSAKKSAPSKTLKSKAVGSAGKQAKAVKKLGKAGTVFSLDAADAREVCVAGSFNGWTIVPLSRNAAGTWTCTMQLEPGEYEYRFFVDGVWWDDPMNEMRRENEFGTHNCILTISE